MPQWFEYTPRNTFLHRLNPLARVTLFITILILISFYYDPYYLTALGIVAFAIFFIAKTPKKWMIVAVPAAAYRFFEFLIVGLGLARPGLFRVWPKELLGILLFEFTVPFTELRIKLTYGALIWALAQTSHIILGAAITLTLIYTTSLNDYIKLLRRFHFPYQLVYVITVAFKFVPDLFRTYTTIISAQRLRGWAMRTKNPVKAAKLAGPLIVPLARQIIFYVDRLALSSQIRGFGATKVEYKIKLNMERIDYAIVIICLSTLIVALYLLFTYNMGIL